VSGLILTRLRRIADFAIPWGVGVFLVLVALDEDPDLEPSFGLGEEIGVLLAVVQGAALRWRRGRPELVMAVVLVAGVAYQLIFPALVVPVGPLFAIASLAAARPPTVSLPWLAALELLAASNFLTTTAEDALFTIGIVVGAWALGEASRNRRMAIEEETQRAVAEERARIARELHDVIAHSVSVMVIQASAAGDVFDERPDQARAALGSIETAGREALGDLRRLIGAVRPDGGEEPTRPWPGLDRLEELADHTRAGGLEVVVRRQGRATPLPSGADLSAYRIIQEALTNTLRHARATRVEVVVTVGSDAVEIDVTDNGRAVPGSDARGAGLGLVGMRERAALLGGTLEAGPSPNGGYRVHARLPLGENAG
jgi:signal transduction histidine kinase